MNTLSYYVWKLGMMDKFGYTFVHAMIDFAILVSLLMFVIGLVVF